uniref:Uncharacterized protein n=1 Tax=Pithovirus LCPAC101 TaxID=2506586 RepID=A0A481Z4A5_9VIRU|nr:MAG: uncharacterized protein LCPAC101_01610 [Pithovirus LCPAC101]
MISDDGYYVIVIIISIIGFILIISFAFYYLYIPFIRINSILQDTIKRGGDIISRGSAIENQVDLTNKQIQAMFVGFCALNDDKSTVIITIPFPPVQQTVGDIFDDAFDDFCENLDLEIPTSS